MELNEKKQKKRRDIAIATIALFLKDGIKNSSISAIAKNADIGKGTIYQYFENKEDIVFEIFDYFSEFHIEGISSMLRSNISSKEKIRNLLKSVVDYTENNEIQSVEPIFKEFYSLSIVTENEKIKEYNRKFFETYQNILRSLVKEGIQSGEIKNKKALDLIHIITAAGDGLLFYNNAIKDFKNPQNFEDYMSFIFDFFDKE